jgi:5'-methylthioadenosine phosphorylase
MSQDLIPAAGYAVIGGSGTFSINFPEDLGLQEIEVINDKLTFATPFGESPTFKLFTCGNKRVLTCKMHGWRAGCSRGDASRQLFWVLQQAGVKKIIVDGGVGSINHLLKPRDILIPSDYLDFSMRKDVGLGGSFLLSMRQPVCPQIARTLFTTAERLHKTGKVFDRGIYAVTDGRHFESPAEVQMLARLGADMVGQSMCPEVYLAREIGACYGRIDIVVNYAEGIVADWEHRELADIFYNESKTIASIVIETLKQLDESDACGCPELRYNTLVTVK